MMIDVCGLLSDWIGKGYLFSDLSVQLHYGSAIKGIIIIINTFTTTTATTFFIYV